MFACFVVVSAVVLVAVHGSFFARSPPAAEPCNNVPAPGRQLMDFIAFVLLAMFVHCLFLTSFPSHPSRPRGGASLDCNRDGFRDLALLSESVAIGLVVFVNRGTMFDPVPLLPAIALGHYPVCVLALCARAACALANWKLAFIVQVTGDLDRNGLDDIVVASRFNEMVYVFRNTYAPGGPDVSFDVTTVASLGPVWNVDIADVDGEYVSAALQAVKAIRALLTTRSSRPRVTVPFSILWPVARITALHFQLSSCSATAAPTRRTSMRRMFRTPTVR